MATPTDFALAANQKAERKLLVTAVNLGDSIDSTVQGDAPEWCIIGAGVEDSAIADNETKEKITDILGITETTVKKTEPTQDFSPMTIRGGNKLLFKLDDIYRRGALSELTNFEVMVIEAYLDSGAEGTPAYYAEVHKGCTITRQSRGGSGTVDTPISIDYSNDKTLGTTNAYKGSSITFTADT